MTPNMWFMALAFILGVVFTYPQLRKRRIAPKLTVITDPAPSAAQPSAPGAHPEESKIDEPTPQQDPDDETDEPVWIPKPRPAHVAAERDSEAEEAPWWDQSFIHHRPTEADTLAFLDLVRWSEHPADEETNAES